MFGRLKPMFLALGIFVVALYLLVVYLRRTSMFFPDVYPEGYWNAAQFQPQPRDVWFSTSDGVRLHGWHFAAAAADAPLIVWCHGNGGNLTYRADMASELARRGVSVLLFDWRGYGRSEGRPSEGALKHDAIAAWEFATSELGIPGERIVTYGESLGGPYAAWIAKQRKVRSVVIENSFPSLMLLGNEIYPLPLGYFAPFALQTTRWLNEAGVPVLVMHGRRDDVIPFALGERLYRDLETPKEFFVSETARHSEIPAVEGGRYYDAVVRGCGVSGE